MRRHERIHLLRIWKLQRTGSDGRRADPGRLSRRLWLWSGPGHRSWHACLDARAWSAAASLCWDDGGWIVQEVLPSSAHYQIGRSESRNREAGIVTGSPSGRWDFEIRKLEVESMENEAIQKGETVERRAVRSKGRHGLGHVYKHRANWWLDLTHEGRRHRTKIGPIKLLEKRQARQIADERIRALMLPKPTKRSWVRYRGKPAKETPLGYAVNFFNDTPLKDITPNRVEDFRLHLLNVAVGRRRLKRASANRYVSLLRHSFYWAIQNGDAEKNPVAALNQKMLDEEQASTRVLEEGEEQKKFLEAMPAWLRLITIFCLQTAARRGELVNLTWESLHPDSVELCETKDSEKRSIRLSPDARAILVLLRPKEIDPKAFVFEPSTPRKTLVSRIRREWKHALKNSRIARIRFHDLRHTALTRLIHKRTDIRTVKDIAGHSSLKTTQRYPHSSDKIQQQAVEKLSGDFRRYLSTAGQDSFENIPASATIQ
jgi:integrase